MKILILTQTVDDTDPILGFFCRWIIEFAKQCESIVVITLSEGHHTLPPNVSVVSLGKEKKLGRLCYLINFYYYLWKFRNDYDGVFVHMNVEYSILGGLIWRLLGKQVGLWYTHRAVSIRLRLAEKFSHIVFTASKESFRLPSVKVQIVGHGIDLHQFRLKTTVTSPDAPYTIVSVSRLSPVKNINQMLAAAKILADKNFSFHLTIIGGPATVLDQGYAKKLEQTIKDNNLQSVVTLLGSRSQAEMTQLYPTYDLFVNLSDTGSMDKGILEAMACGLSILTSNEAFVSILPAEAMVSSKPELLAEKIIKASTDRLVKTAYREYIVANHALPELVKKIIRYY